MNEQLEKQLARVIEKSIELAEKTGDFVIEQGGELLEEFYRWHLWSNAVTLVFCVLSAVLIIVVFFKVGIKHDENNPVINNYDRVVLFGNEYHLVFIILYSVLGSICFVFSIAEVIFSIYRILQILVAPKLYLLEHFNLL